MDPDKTVPYFPPPPGQLGVPPPLPPRSPGAVPTGPPSFNVNGQYHVPHHTQTPHPLGHQPMSPSPPTSATPQYLQTAPTYQNPHPDYLYQPGAPFNNPYPNSQPPFGQHHSTPPTYQNQSSPSTAGQTPSWSNTLQQTSSLFTGTQKVLGSYQGIKSKARAKLTQYLTQPAAQPRPDYHQTPHSQNQNHGYGSSPLASPVNSVTNVHPHYPQPHQYQYGSPAFVSSAAEPAPVSQYPHQYIVPAYGHSPANHLMSSPGPRTEQEEQAYQHAAYSSQVAMPYDAALNQPPVVPSANSPAQHSQSFIPAALNQAPLVPPGSLGSTAMALQPAVVNYSPHIHQAQETTLCPSGVAQNPHGTSDDRPTGRLENQTPPLATTNEPRLHQPPTQPYVNAFTDEPSRKEPEDSRVSGLDLTDRTQPSNTEDTHQGPAPPQLPIPGKIASFQQDSTAQVMELISDKLGGMSLLATDSSRCRALGPEDEGFHEWKRPLPNVSEEGEPSITIWECPEQRELDYEAEWYHLADVPDFLICTRCHDMYLSGTSFSASLERVRRVTGRCRFNVPRITRLLLPEYLQHKDDSHIRGFMSTRLSIQDCKGQQGAKGEAGIKWFKPLDSRLGGFVSCEACHEDVILATSLRQNFVAHDTAQSPDAAWACDVCLPFIGRSLVKYSKRAGNAWEDWVQAAVKHMALPQCEKKPASPSSRRWMQLRGQKSPDLKICEKCFEETLALTPLEGHFEIAPHEPSATGLDWMDVALGYRTEEPTPWLCSATSFPMQVSIAAAKSQQDISVLYKACEVILSSPQCTEQGILDGTWYTLRGGSCDSYNICAACYAAFVGTWQLDRFYQPAEGQKGAQPILCSLQRSAPRWLQHIYRMQEAIETGVWSRYAGFVRKFDGVPDCPREQQVANRQWYGWDDCTICAECYITFCKESSPAPGAEMDYNNHVVTDTRMCCLYSPRMRQKWVEACEKGDGRELVEFSRVRHGVYVETVLQVRMLRQMQELQMMNAMHAGLMSVTYQGIESMRVVSGTTDGYEHGNSTLGWHATEEGATSAAFRNQMQSGMSQSNSASTWMTIFQLTQKWSEFE